MKEALSLPALQTSIAAVTFGRGYDVTEQNCKRILPKETLFSGKGQDRGADVKVDFLAILRFGVFFHRV